MVGMKPNPYESPPIPAESGEASGSNWGITIAGALAVTILLPVFVLFCWWAFLIVTSLLELRPPA